VPPKATKGPCLITNPLLSQNGKAPLNQTLVKKARLMCSSRIPRTYSKMLESTLAKQRNRLKRGLNNPPIRLKTIKRRRKSMKTKKMRRTNSD